MIGYNPVKFGASPENSACASTPPMETETWFTVVERGEEGAASPASTGGSTAPNPAHYIVITSPAWAGLEASASNSSAGVATRIHPWFLPDPSTVNTAGWAAATVTLSGTV